MSGANSSTIGCPFSCAAGSYSNSSGQTSAAAACIHCSVGSYCTGGASISVCEPGSYSLNSSLTSQLQCSSCPQNQYCSNGTATACLPGSFSSGTGAALSSSCLVDCSPIPSTLIGTGVSAGNCSLDGNALHAGQSCLLGLQTNYSLTGGSLIVRCLINSTLAFVPPTAIGFSCLISVPLHAALGNCTSELPSGASCNLVAAGGFSLASGSLTLACSLGQLSAYPTFASLVLPPPLISLVDPPSTFQLGSGLLVLQASASSTAASSSLQYTWSYISAADQAAGLPPTILPPSSSAQLQLDPSSLLPDTTYNFSVRVVDTNQASSSSSGVAPASVASTTVRVILATQQVQAVAGVDPCSNNPSFQCLNGGRCVASATTPGSLNYTLSCACLTSPVQFLGANCGFALLEAPDGIASYSGGTNIALYGVGFNTLLYVAVAGRLAQFQTDSPPKSAPTLNTTTDDEEWRGVLSRWPDYADQLERALFVAPALVSLTVNQTGVAALSRSLLADAAPMVNPPAAYQMLTLSSLILADSSGTGKLLVANFSNQLYYSSSTCLAVGQWTEDGAGGCLSCPEGAFCPGAGRAWPLAGYWSWSEYQAPTKCIVEEACPGYTNTPTAGASATSASLFVDTQICAVGYESTRCASCSAGYYQLNSYCYYCGSSVDQSATIATTVVVGVAIMTILALAVSILSSLRLAQAMQVFSLLQGAAAVGVAGAQSSPYFGKQLLEGMTYFNFSQYTCIILAMC